MKNRTNVKWNLHQTSHRDNVMFFLNAKWLSVKIYLVNVPKRQRDNENNNIATKNITRQNNYRTKFWEDRIGLDTKLPIKIKLDLVKNHNVFDLICNYFHLSYHNSSACDTLVAVRNSLFSEIRPVIRLGTFHMPNEVTFLIFGKALFSISRS